MRASMKLFSKVILYLSFVFVLSSCGPVYKVAHDYKPPSSSRGLNCINGCQSKLTQCNRQCSVKFSQCSINAERQAKQLLPGLLQAYPNELERWLEAKEKYQRDLDWYEYRRDMAEARRDRYLSHCIDKGKKRSACVGSYGRLYDTFPYYSRPTFNTPRPKKPTLAKEAAKLRKLNCDKTCGCESKYRLCYTSCGGVVKSKKICVKNCSN